MIQGDDLKNRQGQPAAAQPEPMKGQAEADAAIAGMKGAKPVPPGKPDDLASLRKRIEVARSVAAPAGDNQFAQGCFNRGRDAALSIIDGE